MTASKQFKCIETCCKCGMVLNNLNLITAAKGKLYCSNLCALQDDNEFTDIEAVAEHEIGLLRVYSPEYNDIYTPDPLNQDIMLMCIKDRIKVGTEVLVKSCYEDVIFRVIVDKRTFDNSVGFEYVLTILEVYKPEEVS